MLPGNAANVCRHCCPRCGGGAVLAPGGQRGDARRILHCQGHPHTPANATALQWRRSPPVRGGTRQQMGLDGDVHCPEKQVQFGVPRLRPAPRPPPASAPGEKRRHRRHRRRRGPLSSPGAPRPAPGSRPELPKRRKEDEGLIAGGGGGGEQWEGGRGGRTGPGEGAGSRASVRLELGHGRRFPAPSPDPWGGLSARIPARIPRSATTGSTGDPPPPTCGVVALGE